MQPDSRARILNSAKPAILRHRLLRNAVVSRFYVAAARRFRDEGDFDQAFSVWQFVLETWPGQVVAYRGMSSLLRAMGRLEDAAHVINLGLSLYPADVLTVVEAAQVAQYSGDWEAAGGHWEKVVFNPDAKTEWLKQYGFALLTLGRFESLERFLKDMRRKYPDYGGFLFLEALFEGARQRFDTSLQLWREFQRRYPDDPEGWEHYGRIYQARDMARLEAGDDHSQKQSSQQPAEPAKVEVVEDEARRQLVMGFESIGRDCEFGLVQRRFGAEPLGLLRFNTVSFGGLVSAVVNRFSDMGQPETTELVVESGEFFLKDRRWGLEMHTFIFEGQQSPDVLYKKLCRRVVFLKEKLLSDLAEARKVIVFASPDITREDLDVLHRALKALGPVTLLHIRPVAAKLAGGESCAPGGVVRLDDDLFVGYLSQLGATVARTWDIMFDEWISICGEVRRSLP